jgi:hypothetical protein
MSENTSILDQDFAAESGHYLDNSAKVEKFLKIKGLSSANLKENLAKFLYNSVPSNWGESHRDTGKYKFKKHPFESMADRLLSCGQEWLPFSDTAGHEIYGLKSCGLPFCPTCGKPGSSLNQKRSNRVKEILLGFPCIGHFVFTLPKEVSSSLPGSDQINKLYQLAWNILKDWLSAEAAIIVLHFCGDKKNDLHLHFDCSFPILHTNGDCSYPLGLLNMARAQWTAGINKVFKTSYLDTVGHYNFVNTLAQEHHLIRYITRSTVPAEKFMELTEAEKLYCINQGKKKIIRYFGEFVGKKKAAFLAKYKVKIERIPGDLIAQRICPICNEKMRPKKDKHSGEMKRYFIDDMPLTQVERYDDHTFVDREIMAWLRQKEKEKPKPPRDLLEAIGRQEMQDIIDQSLDQSCEEEFNPLIARW